MIILNHARDSLNCKLYAWNYVVPWHHTCSGYTTEARSTTGTDSHCEIRKIASCMNLRVHSRKGSLLSNVSSQELSRPMSQLSAHDKEDEAAKKRNSNGS